MISCICGGYKIFPHLGLSLFLPSAILSLPLLVVYSFHLIATQSYNGYLFLAWSRSVSSPVLLLWFLPSPLDKLIPPLSLRHFAVIASVFCHSIIFFFLPCSFLATFSLWLVTLIEAGLSLQATASVFFIFFAIQSGSYNWLHWFQSV